MATVAAILDFGRHPKSIGFTSEVQLTTGGNFGMIRSGVFELSCGNQNGGRRKKKKEEKKKILTKP